MMFVSWGLITRGSSTKILAGADTVDLDGRNGKAILMLHGFAGSPGEFGDLASALNERGYAVRVPLLPGHGTHPWNLFRTDVRDLEDAVRDEYLRMKSEYSDVTVVGFSMGGAFAIYLAEELDYQRLVLLAPQLKTRLPKYLIFSPEFYLTLYGPFMPIMWGPNIFAPINDREGANDTRAYNFIPSMLTLKVLRMGRQAYQKAQALTMPSLWIHGAKDTLLDHRISQEIANKLDGATFVSLPRSNHLLCRDYDKHLIAGLITDFIEATQPPRPDPSPGLVPGVMLAQPK